MKCYIRNIRNKDDNIHRYEVRGEREKKAERRRERGRERER